MAVGRRRRAADAIVRLTPEEFPISSGVFSWAARPRVDRLTSRDRFGIFGALTLPIPWCIICLEGRFQGLPHLKAICVNRGNLRIEFGGLQQVAEKSHHVEFVWTEHL